MCWTAVVSKKKRNGTVHILSCSAVACKLNDMWHCLKLFGLQLFVKTME